MLPLMRTFWQEMGSLLFRRPAAVQVAALCWRVRKGKTEVLLVTSSQGRWLLPKGWPIDGLEAHQAALQEAWEEAGVKKGIAARKPIAQFRTTKTDASGVPMPCTQYVYKVEVKDVVKDYPECDMRDRQWLTTTKAANVVDEEGLRPILRDFSPS